MNLYEYWHAVVDNTITRAFDQFYSLQTPPVPQQNFYRDQPPDSDMIHRIDAVIRKATGVSPDTAWTDPAKIPNLNALVVAVPFHDYTSTVARVWSYVQQGGFFLFLCYELDAHQPMDTAACVDILRNGIFEGNKYFDDTTYLTYNGRSRRMAAVIVQKGVPNEGQLAIPKPLTSSQGLLSRLWYGKTDEWAAYFDWTYYNPAWDLTKQAADFLPRLGAITALDAGCGAGPDTHYVIETFGEAKVTAIDSSKIAESYVKKRLRPDDQLPRLNFITADLTTYLFSKAQYDLIICRDVVGFVDQANAYRIVSGLQKSLKPGGIIAMTFFGPGNAIDGTLSTYTVAQVNELFQNFTILQCKDLNFVEALKTPPQQQHIISILAQKVL